MKKLPRKFSEGGKAAPAPQPKPQDRKDSMPDWAKKELEQKNQDAKTKAGYEKATAPDRLKYKAGGKIKKFAEGGRFSSDVYERARKQIQDKYTTDSDKPSTPALDELIGERKSAEKPATKAAPKAAPKKTEPKMGRSGGAGATEPDVPYGRRDAPTLGDRKTTRSESNEGPTTRGREESYPDIQEPRRYLSRGRNYSATGDMSPQAEKVVEAGMTVAGLTGLGRIPSMLRRMGQASRTMEAGRTRAAANRMVEAERAGEAAASRDLIKRSGAKQRAEKESMDLERDAMPVKRKAPRDLDEERMAGEGGPNFKRGGMAKYAKGGGVESKGKTKGTVVKMASGGSVKGWGIARGSKACKMK